jgi:hypothetical protein
VCVALFLFLAVDHASDPNKFLAGSDNGTLRLFDVERMIATPNGVVSISVDAFIALLPVPLALRLTVIAGGVVCEFPQFSSLTSVHANCTDTLAISSGYASDVALYHFSLSLSLSLSRSARIEVH